MHEQRYNDIAGRGLRRLRRDHVLIALRLTAAVLSLALVVELLWALLCSPRFQVRQVKLVGLRRLGPQAVMSRAAIAPGSSLARLPTRKLRREVEAIPAVEWASVHRDWPNTLTIVIRERKPAAFIRCGKGIVLVDRQGVAFGGVCCDLVGLPELKGVRVSLWRLGQARPSKELKAVLAALGEAQEAELVVEQVETRAQGELALRLVDGTALYLGRPQQLRRKVSQAKLALMQLQPLHQIEYIDVSCPDAAVWKPRAES